MTTTTMPNSTHSATSRVTVEHFARDLWEATRSDIREQLGTAVDADAFERSIPAWENLPERARREKIATIREDWLRLLDKAGYEVRRKVP